MYFKTLVLVLALPFLLKADDAKKIVNTLDEQDLDEISKFEETEEDGESVEEYIRTLASDDADAKQSFSKLSLKLAKLNVLEEITKRNKIITSLKNTVNDNSKDKCRKIKKVGEPIVHHHSGTTYGTWMRDPLGLLGPGKIWYMNGFNGNKVLEFKDMNHFKGGAVAKTYTLPYKFDGTGSVVYGRYLYFNRANTTYIVKYDLVTEKIAKEYKLPSTVTPRKYSYQWGGYNTMDLSVDETGLWVLYSHAGDNGRLCAMLLDSLTLNYIHHYCGISSQPRNKMGNAFVACGVVYSIDSFIAAIATINYAYDTATGSRTDPDIKFVNRFRYLSMVTYNPREKVLYAWDNKRQITYPLEFQGETQD